MGIKVNTMKVTEEQYTKLTDLAKLNSLKIIISNTYISDYINNKELSKAYNIIYELSEKLSKEIEIDDKPD